MRVSIVTVGVACALLGTAWPTSAGADPLDDDLDQMLTWFTGRFDNHWQAREDAEGEVEEPHGRIHSIFHPVDFPSLGDNVFYVQQYADGDPNQIYRQRLYRFAVNREHGDIELVIYAPPDPEAVVDAHLDPSKLAGLTVDDLRHYPGCEVHWTRKNRGTDDDHFYGVVPKGACQVESRRSGRTLVIMDDLRLDADEIWIQDRAVDTEGAWVYGHQGGVAHKLRRVRFFDCWAAAPKVVGQEEGPDAWHLWRPIELHDQGGTYDLVKPGEETVWHRVELFEAVFRGREDVQVLELAVRDPEQERSTAYTWSEPTSSRLGINLRFLQIGCTLDPDRLF